LGNYFGAGAAKAVFAELDERGIEDQLSARGGGKPDAFARLFGFFLGLGH
jgi:hypothetical protein